jgi:pullulanase-type alpha-1,6-glucosidase
MSKTSTLFKYSALALVIGLSACEQKQDQDGTLSCTAPQILNDVGDACIEDSDALIVPAANQAVVYYKRQDGDYDGWGLHLWGDEMAEEGISWPAPLLPDGVHSLYGAYFLVDLTTDDWTGFNFIVHSGDTKDISGSDLVYSRVEFGEDVFLFQGVEELFPDPMLEIPVSLSGASAHFIDLLDVSGASIMFPARVESNEFKLWHSATAELVFDEETKTVSGGTEVDMALEPMSDAQAEALPHLSNLTGFWVDATTAEAKTMLKGQLWVVESNAEGEALQVTRVQTPNVLDALYATAAEAVQLGSFDNAGNTQFSLWAPTAQNVEVIVYNDSYVPTETIALTEDSTTGVWSATASSDLTDSYYLYDVDVFHHVTDDIEQHLVTDPYSLSLSINSMFSQVVDLDAASLKPATWTVDRAFADITNPEDISVYETHIRDISISDTTKASASQDGTFMAFTDNTRESMLHLAALRTAGMTAVQILPAFDIATIDEDEGERVDITDTVADYCALSAEATTTATDLGLTCDATIIETALATFDPTTSNAQEFYSHLRAADSFNWGYDPFHYTVPEGSYSTDPRSTARILEFREMVEALHDMDYMVVMDVVYNHTNASGLNEKSVLDKVVPGYYHRRDITSGSVTRDSCCDDTATEHKMMSKLMSDSLVVWARDYQVDAFRFDLMGLQTLASMNDALAAVQAVNPDVYFYGEGWDYGAAGENARGKNASQTNVIDTKQLDGSDNVTYGGIGTFTDRLRDGVRGGGPFDNMDGEEQSLRRNQGLSNSAVANELNLVGSVDPDAGTDDDDLKTPDLELAENVLKNADLVRLGLAGNLKTFGFESYEGTSVNGSSVEYGDNAAGYADDPQQIVNYVSKHDNQTLWDIIAYKAADTVTSADRARMQALAVATGAYAQGVPFFHMGVDLLRSKSMERDSYDSGDWFNKVDFANNADSNWNVGLPREDKDGSNWDIIETIVADVDSDPSVIDVQWMRDQFLEMLEIRSSSPLFRLTTADEIKSRVGFHNTGTDQTAGVIAMSIDDGTNAPSDLDTNYDAIVVIFNYTDASQDVVIDGAAGFTQHIVQSETTGVAFDAGSSTFTVPALSTVVFVADQGPSQGTGIPAGDVAPYGDTTLYAVGAISDWTHVYDGYYAGDDVYKFAVNLEAAGTFAFRFADASWGSSTNADSFTNGAGSAFALVAAGDGDNNFSITVGAGEEGEYEFTLDLSEAAAEVTIEAKDYALALDVYVRGTVIDWNPIPDGLFAYNDAGDYSVWIDVAAGDYIFKVGDAGWTAGTNFGAGSITDVTLSEAMPLDGSGDINITIPTNNYYEFKLDTAKSLTAPELTVTEDTAPQGDLYIRGSMNGFGATDLMSYEGLGIYSLELTLTAATAYQFKVAHADWGDANWGFGTDTTGTDFALTDNGGNFEFTTTTAGNYVFTFDAFNTVVNVALAP